jgi:hypothetical protein
MKRNKYTLYWLTGQREVVEGFNVDEALTLAGYGNGPLGALDFYAHGDNKKYTWDAEKRKWIKT